MTTEWKDVLPEGTTFEDMGRAVGGVAKTGMSSDAIAKAIVNSSLQAIVRGKKESTSIPDADPSICTLTLGGADATLTNEIYVVYHPGYISHSLALAEVSYANMYRLATVTTKSGGNVSSTQSQIMPTWKFSTDAENLIITLKRGSQFTLQVDGVFYSKSTLVAPDPGSNDSPVLLNFTDKRKRDITVNLSSGDSAFKGVSTLPTDSVWVATKSALKAVLQGDSFSTGTNPNIGGLCYTNVLMSNLGIDNYMISGEGGTGFVNNQSDTKLNYLERVSDITSMDPDVVFVSATVNDNLFLGGLDANITAWYDAVRSALPDVIIVVLGAQGRADTETIAMEQQLMNTFIAIGDSRLIAVPIVTTATPMITGTGNEGALAGDGNADIYIYSDGTHYNEEGHIFAGNVTAEIVIEAIEKAKA